MTTSCPDDGPEDLLVTVQAPVKRWGASLPVTIIDAWEEFVLKSGFHRPYIIGAALHAFMKLPCDQRAVALCGYGEFKEKAATDRAFHEAMTGLGFADVEPESP